MSLFGSHTRSVSWMGCWIILLVLVVIANLTAFSSPTFAQADPGCNPGDKVKGCYTVSKKVNLVPKVVTSPPTNPKTTMVVTPSQKVINPQAYAPPPPPQAAIYSSPSNETQISQPPLEDGAPAELRPDDSAAAHLAVSRLGLDKARNLVRNLSASVLSGCQIDGRGGPCGDIDPNVTRQTQTEFFTGAFAGQVAGDASPVTRSETDGAVFTYDGIPGGIVLEGAANFAEVSSVAYDPNFNALTLNNTLVFFMRTPPHEVAALAQGIADDERVGVSLGEPYRVYGQLGKQSDVAINLQLADSFLGDIAFARNEWTRDYKFADGYTPKPEQLKKNVAVFFKVSGFEFDVIANQIRVSSSVFSARIVPLVDQKEGEENLLPDDGAIERGEIPAAYSANAQHIADNVDYYRRERIIEQVFDYGAVAAVLRGLKSQGFDLHSLAYSISNTWSQ
jgi:hypothetical protein